MEYYCSGGYEDVSAEAFYVAQMDLAYRKEWDSWSESVTVLEREEGESSEVRLFFKANLKKIICEKIFKSGINFRW